MCRRGSEPVGAIGLSARRFFAKTRIRRTLLFAGAGLAISVGRYALVSTAGGLLPFIHSDLGANVFQTLAGILAGMPGTAFSCILLRPARA